MTPDRHHALAYLGWLRQVALPVWAERGFDPVRQRFHERLDSTGRPLCVPHRSMVQARQIYVFAQAGRLGWHDRGLDLAHRAMDSLLRDYTVPARAGTALRFASDGPGAQASDSYGLAFVLLAAATLHAAAPSSEMVKLIEGVVAHLDDCLVDKLHGGLFDTFPADSLAKRQNPVMHYLEALLAIEEVFPGGSYLERAIGLADLALTSMTCAQSGVIQEHFSRHWGTHADVRKAGLVEPGHLFEWIWLLDRLSVRSGKDYSAPIAAFHAGALRGVLASARIVDGLAAPELTVSAPSHRLWPHTEAIKAAAVARRLGLSEAITVGATAKVLLTDFLDRPFVGGWIDRIDRRGFPLTNEVPASSLYHLMLAGAELDAAVHAGDDDAVNA